MSDTTIFIFGCCVMGVVLAATFVSAIAGSDSKSLETAESDRKTKGKSVRHVV